MDVHGQFSNGQGIFSIQRRSVPPKNVLNPSKFHFLYILQLEDGEPWIIWDKKFIRQFYSIC